MADVVRVNTRISRKLNEWLNRRSYETGLSKSAMIMLALENYYKQTEAVDQMVKWEAIYREVDDLKRRFDRPPGPAAGGDGWKKCKSNVASEVEQWKSSGAGLDTE